MAGSGGETITASIEAGDGTDSGGAPALFLVLECERPRAGSARYGLGGVETVLIGRGPGPGRNAELSGSAGAATLRIQVPDGRMSSSHARLERSFTRWVLSDAGSKNGTSVNAGRVERATLNDGDLIELGHTSFVFRSSLSTGTGGAILDGESLPAALPGLPTVVPALAGDLDRLVKVADARVPILLGGETGTGKELVARAVHSRSGRSGRFVAVNCGALPEHLAEAELFGHRRGAFSGAVDDRPGHVRTAERGTLLLDEIGDLPLKAQAILLRVLQEQEVVPVGDSIPVPVDVRVIAASHRDLDRQVAAGEFRADLLARLRGLQVTLPALRERREDFGLVLAGVLGQLVPDRGRAIVLSGEAGRALLAHDWPLNIRELHQAMAAAIALAGDGPIGPAHLPEAVRAAQRGGGAEALLATLSAEERGLRDRLIELLQAHRGNIAAVARSLGKARPQVHRWLERFGLDAAAYRDRP